MIALAKLKSASRELLEYCTRQNEVKEAESYVSSNRHNVYRIGYHSLIPSNGLEEPKSEEGFGLSVRILFKDGKQGFGAADSGLGKDSFRQAYDKAAESAVLDTDFHSLPEPMKGGKGGNFSDLKKKLPPKKQFWEKKKKKSFWRSMNRLAKMN